MTVSISVIIPCNYKKSALRAAYMQGASDRVKLGIARVNLLGLSQTERRAYAAGWRAADEAGRAVTA